MPVLACLLMVQFGFSALLTRDIYLDALGTEKEQIAIDNVAIRLGQLDRRVFMKLQEGNNELRKIELGHHLVHACAQSPFAGACAAQDQGVHIAIQVQRLKMVLEALKSWRSNPDSAKQIAREFNLDPSQIEIANRLPLFPQLYSKVCSDCFLSVWYEVRRLPRVYHVYLRQKPHINVWGRMIGRSILEGEKWTYQLSKHGKFE